MIIDILALGRRRQEAKEGANEQSLPLSGCSDIFNSKGYFTCKYAGQYVWDRLRDLRHSRNLAHIFSCISGVCVEKSPFLDLYQNEGFGIIVLGAICRFSSKLSRRVDDPEVQIFFGVRFSSFCWTNSSLST